MPGLSIEKGVDDPKAKVRTDDVLLKIEEKFPHNHNIITLCGIEKVYSGELSSLKSSKDRAAKEAKGENVENSTKFSTELRAVLTKILSLDNKCTPKNMLSLINTTVTNIWPDDPAKLSSVEAEIATSETQIKGG